MTELITVDPKAPGDSPGLARAAQLLRDGRLVAFPTETVYGLGAHALDAAAVGRIFEAKGRPPSNPVIVHVDSEAAAMGLAAHWPETAKALAAAFWPGPLTLVLPKADCVPGIVTAGGPTVGIRVPAHPVALALLREAGVPVAAPSANRTTQLSPTLAVHVLKGLKGLVDAVVDGGSCERGLESTVADLTDSRVIRILRPGPITAEDIKAATGLPVEVEAAAERDGTFRSPGLARLHYAPRAALEVIPRGELRGRLEQHQAAGRHVGLLCLGGAAPLEGTSARMVIPDDAHGYGAGLYAALHELDDAGVDVILAEEPPRGPLWAAVHDRLARAAARE